MADRLDRLERLDALRRGGGLSDEEYAREKAAILASPRGARRRPLVAAALLLVLAVGGSYFYLRPARPAAAGAAAPRPARAAPSAAIPAATPPRSIRDEPGAAQLRKAFAAAFGAATQAERSVEGESIVFHPGSLRWLGDRAVLISPGRNRDDCHACAGTLAVHYLDPVGDGFALRGEWLSGGGRDDWGQPPDWRISTEISTRPMLRTEGGGGNQGIFCTDASFFEFTDDGPRRVAQVPLGYSNAGAVGEGPTEIEGRIVDVRRDRSFLVRYSGSRTFSERWVRRGPVYRPSGGETQLPRC